MYCIYSKVALGFLNGTFSLTDLSGIESMEVPAKLMVLCREIMQNTFYTL